MTKRKKNYYHPAPLNKKRCKKRMTRYLKRKPNRAEVNHIALAYRRTITALEMTGKKVPLDLSIGIKRLENYLGYRVKN